MLVDVQCLVFVSGAIWSFLLPTNDLSGIIPSYIHTYIHTYIHVSYTLGANDFSLHKNFFLSPQHDVDIEEKGLPPVLRCTGQKLQDTGVYAIGMMSWTCYIYIACFDDVIGSIYRERVPAGGVGGAAGVT